MRACCPLLYFLLSCFGMMNAGYAQVESELRNDFFAFYQNGTFDNSYVKLFGNGNRGVLQFFNQNYNLVGWFDANTEDSGYMGVRSNSGAMTATFNSIQGFQNHGILNIYGGSNERIFAQLYAGTNLAGGLITFGPSSQNTYLSHLSGTPDHGYFGVQDGSDVLKAGLFVDAAGMGTVFADVKNFVAPHPTDEDLEIVYASLEGPEAAVYARGTSRLINGQAEVMLPDHFQAVGALREMTVQITPHDVNTYGIAVTRKYNTGFQVRELKNGIGNFTFDWEAKTIRKAFENYEVIRAKAHRSPASQMGAVPSATAREVQNVPTKKK